MHQNREPREELALAETVADLNHFALRLLKALSDGNDDNIFFSPLSISTSLAMLLAGARGATATEIADALGFSFTEERLQSALRVLSARELTGAIEYRSANRLWAQSGYEILQQFQELTERSFGAHVSQVDFAGGPERARSEINRWTEEHTNGRINNLLAPGAVSPQSRLVMTTALYFLGTWARTFSLKETQVKKFQRVSGEQSDVSMMYQREYVNYHADQHMQLIDKCYLNGDEVGASSSNVAEDGPEFVMSIALPRKEDGVDEIIDLFADTGELPVGPRLRECDLYIPRFEASSSLQLNTALESLGVERAFGDTADFGGISDHAEGLALSELAHKAHLTVNERGTEAAAATAVDMVTLCQTPRFYADHPFVFAIRERKSGLIHFLGRLMQP